MIHFVKRLTAPLQMDKALVLAASGNIVSLVSGALIALLIAKFLSPEVQGYYYAFGTLSTFLLLAEVGLGQAIINFASHEWASLSLDESGRVIGSSKALARLSGIVRFSLRWYGSVAIALLLLLGPGGYLFFFLNSSNEVAWESPWIALCFLQGINIILLPAFYLLQGCNQVASFWFYRLVHQILNAIVICLALIAGANLWTWVFAVGIGVSWSFLFLFLRYRHFIITFLNVPMEEGQIDWKTEIWPIQKKIALTWSSQYFTTQLFVPFTFVFVGPVEAGQMGMAMSLGYIIVALSSNWFVTKIPQFGILVAQKEFEELDKSFSKTLKIALGMNICAVIGISLLVFALEYFHNPISARLLPPIDTLLLMITTVFSTLISALTVYLRAHKQEPLVQISLTAACLILVTASGFGYLYGAVGIILAYWAVLIIFQVPFSIYVFNRRRLEWHLSP